MPPSTPNTDAIFEALVADRNNPAALRKLIEERQAESVEILRNWMGEAEERA